MAGTSRPYQTPINARSNPFMATCDGSNQYVQLNFAARRAAASGAPLYLPGGIYDIGKPGVQPVSCLDLSGVQHYYGDGPGVTILRAIGTITDYTPLLGFSGTTGVIIRDLEIVVDNSVYPLVPNLELTECTDVLIENVVCSVSGRYGISLTDCVNVRVRNCTVRDYTESGIIAQGSDSDNVVIDDCDVVNVDGTAHGIILRDGNNMHVRGCYSEAAGGFAICAVSVTNGSIRFNRTYNSFLEGCAASCISFSITDNDISWPGGGGNSTDVGISVDESCNWTIIARNTITNAYLHGIIVDGNSANPGDSKFVDVCGNTIINCNQAASAGVAGICLLGSKTVNCRVHDNTIIDQQSHHYYGVAEDSAGGTPDSNQIYSNNIVGALTQRVLLLGAASTTDEWLVFTPTVTATAGGTITTLGTKVIRYSVIGKRCRVYINIHITTNGPGAGSVLCTLPYSPVTDGDGVGGVMVGLASPASKELMGLFIGGGVNIFHYDGTYPGATPVILVLSGEYEISA